MRTVGNAGDTSKVAFGRLRMAYNISKSSCVRPTVLTSAPFDTFTFPFKEIMESEGKAKASCWTESTGSPFGIWFVCDEPGILV
jgi:hypothetical protein